MPTEIRLNFKSFIYAILIVVGIWLMIEIRGTLALLFASFILMSALRPFVEKMVSWKWPRFIAVFVIYLIIICLFTIVGSLLLPPLVSESIRLANNLPNYLITLAQYFNFDQQTIINQVGSLGQNALKVTLSLFSDVLTFFAVAVFTFYLLLARSNTQHFLIGIITNDQRQRSLNLLDKIELRMGAWFRGQLILGLIIGVLSYIGLSLLGISYALPLALIAGVLEMVPTIGPIISAIPAMLIAVTVSPGLAALVALLYYIIQQLENHLFVPQVMMQTVGVAPLISIILLMIGGRLGGIGGIILAIPIYLVIETIVKEVINKKTNG